MLRITWATAALAVMLTLVGAPSAASPNYPARIDFPPGWRAEGIATGKGHTFYAVDSSNGAIYQGDFRTGTGEVIIPGAPGRS